MRYTQSRERSAELLRAALGHMGQHDAAFNPVTFAVWYEHSAGTNAKLTRAIESAVSVRPRLDDETIARLYREHVGGLDEVAMQRVAGEFRQVMSSVAESAARTGDRAGAFGDRLSGLTRALGANASSELAPLVHEALAETAEMRDVASALQRQVVASGHEIERLRDDLSRARDEVLIDPLTRLLNRRGFDQSLAEMLDPATKTGDPQWLVMLDIDHFKAVNDTYGHVMGDRVLQAVAEALRSGVLHPAACIARYGGEEFAVLLQQCSRGDAIALAESCRQRVKSLKVRDRRTQAVILTVTISAGLASVQPVDDATSLIARADEALYAAKAAGRDRVHCA